MPGPFLAARTINFPPICALTLLHHSAPPTPCDIPIDFGTSDQKTNDQPKRSASVTYPVVETKSSKLRLVIVVWVISKADIRLPARSSSPSFKMRGDPVPKIALLVSGMGTVLGLVVSAATRSTKSILALDVWAL